MIVPRSVAAYVGAALLAAGCAARPPIAYRVGLAAGDRAYHAGRFVEAAGAYERAAREANSARDRGDAQYRAAMACRRGGDLRCTARLLTVVASEGGDWDHAPRARLELASLALQDPGRDARESGLDQLRALIEQSPDTGPARGALRLALRTLDEDPSQARSIAWLETLATVPRVSESIIIESVLAARATRLEARGDAAAAIGAWRDLLARVPYPNNSHWDDGHLALARLLRAQGRAREAVQAIERMLAVREASWGNGSYAAPRFDDGALLRAEMLRDDLADPAAAADAYHQVYAEHTTSLRRDDALWEEAALRRRADPAAACRLWRTITTEFACRRFARRARAELLGCGVSVPAPAGCVAR